jgi:hypothetical protein
MPKEKQYTKQYKNTKYAKKKKKIQNKKTDIKIILTNKIRVIGK